MCPAAADSPGKPAVGIGFRLPIAGWICDNLNLFDVLEITVDHYINGGDGTRAIFKDLVGRIPMVAHSVGLSIGTDAPLDEAYLEQVARSINDLKMPSYSEHLAWTKTPEIDLANLLPVPKTEAVAESIIEKVRFVQSYVGVPFSLENISYLFDFPDSQFTDAEFFNLISRSTGVEMLLDIENLYLNSLNHRFEPREFLGALPPAIVTGIHVAGGPVVCRDYLTQPVWIDAHSDQVPQPVFDLLDDVLAEHRPATVVLERDEALERVDEIAQDIERIRAHVDGWQGKVRTYAGEQAARSSN
jgi:uncharacterized protein (UPF0276 family)